MTGRQYLLQGTVLREGTRQGVPDLRVEIWVKMPAQDERLGETTSEPVGWVERINIFEKTYRFEGGAKPNINLMTRRNQMLILRE
jgi:hypothetical protein